MKFGMTVMPDPPFSRMLISQRTALGRMGLSGWMRDRAAMMIAVLRVSVFIE